MYLLIGNNVEKAAQAKTSWTTRESTERQMNVSEWNAKLSAH